MTAPTFESISILFPLPIPFGAQYLWASKPFVKLRTLRKKPTTNYYGQTNQFGDGFFFFFQLDRGDKKITVSVFLQTCMSLYHMEASRKRYTFYTWTGLIRWNHVLNIPSNPSGFAIEPPMSAHLQSTPHTYTCLYQHYRCCSINSIQWAPRDRTVNCFGLLRCFDSILKEVLLAWLFDNSCSIWGFKDKRECKRKQNHFFLVCVNVIYPLKHIWVTPVKDLFAA